jgi:hypothetical protein
LQPPREFKGFPVLSYSSPSHTPSVQLFCPRIGHLETASQKSSGMVGITLNQTHHPLKDRDQKAMQLMVAGMQATR